MSSDPKEEAREIIDGLEDESVQEEIDQIKNENPMVGLRNSLLTFIQSRLSVIENEESFRSEVKEAIKSKIRNNEISVNQLLDLLKTVDRDTDTSVNSILNLLKPGSSGESNPIFGRGGFESDPKDKGMLGLEEAGPDKTEALNKLARALQYLDRESKSTEEN